MPDIGQSFHGELARLVSERIASRIWRKDPTVWVSESPGGDKAANILGWLELPGRLPALIERASAAAADIRAAGMTDAVVLGMGGSSMTPEVLRRVFRPGPTGLRLHVLDTVNPVTIASVTEKLDLKTTLFIVASKSGTTVEPLSLEKHFRHALESGGETDVASHFVAESDAGTPLAKRAQAGEFRTWFETPGDVGGRYSALTAFGVFPAALLDIDLGRLADAAQEMTDACRPDSESNPGLALGARLGALANAGRDKVTLLTSPELERFGLWVEQLLAESTGKNGRGLIPVAGEPIYDTADYSDDRQFVYARLDEGDNDAIDRLAGDLEEAGHPVVRIDLPDLGHLAAEFFRWEFATAVAANPLGVYPFDQPDVEAAKDKARALLAGGDSEASGSHGTLAEALDSLGASTKPGDYLVIAAYLHESDDLSDAFGKLRASITNRLGIATTLGYGPRFLHSTGQLYKGGPTSCVMLGITVHGTGDVAVPGESYTLGSLTVAQAAGDFAVMLERGRRTATVTLRGDPVGAVRRVAAQWEHGSR